VNYLFDSSVLVAGLVEIHPHQARAQPWLDRMEAGEIAVALTAHTLAETYTGLTNLPITPRIEPCLALELIRDTAAHARIVPITEADYRRTIQRVAERGLVGGLVYDALIAGVAERLKVDRLVTFNVSHFRRVWPEGHDRIISP
jgi:predicted nucleic acid-binding protein